MEARHLVFRTAPFFPMVGHCGMLCVGWASFGARSTVSFGTEVVAEGVWFCTSRA